MVGGDLDCSLRRACGYNRDEIMQFEGLIDGGKMMKAVGSRGAYGEAQIYLAEGTDARGHQAAACRENPLVPEMLRLWAGALMPSAGAWKEVSVDANPSFMQE